MESGIAFTSAFSALIASLALKHKQRKEVGIWLNHSRDNTIIQENRGNIQIQTNRKDETD